MPPTIRQSDLTKPARTNLVELLPCALITQAAGTSTPVGFTRGLTYTNEPVIQFKRTIKVTRVYGFCMATMAGGNTTLKVGITADDDAIVAATTIVPATKGNNLPTLSLVTADGVVVTAGTTITVTSSSDDGGFRLFMEYEFVETDEA